MVHHIGYNPALDQPLTPARPNRNLRMRPQPPPTPIKAIRKNRERSFRRNYERSEKILLSKERQPPTKPFKNHFVKSAQYNPRSRKVKRRLVFQNDNHCVYKPTHNPKKIFKNQKRCNH